MAQTMRSNWISTENGKKDQTVREVNQSKEVFLESSDSVASKKISNGAL